MPDRESCVKKDIACVIGLSRREVRVKVDGRDPSRFRSAATGRESDERTVPARFLTVLALACAFLPVARAAERPEPPKPTSRTARNIEGWTVRVDDRLLKSPNDALGTRALKLLEAKLAEIKSVVAADRLAKLQTVRIVLDLTHGKLHLMQYHPDAGWLKANGYALDLAKCAHIPEAADLVNPRTSNEQPWCVMHELAHAYHDQVFGFNDPRIRKAYERFKESGHGNSVLNISGNRRRHYALTDQMEFFAEMTEAYFGMNDFFPFNRAELKTAEPEVFELLREIWGPVAERPEAGKARSQPGSAPGGASSRPA